MRTKLVLSLAASLCLASCGGSEQSGTTFVQTESLTKEREATPSVSDPSATNTVAPTVSAVPEPHKIAFLADVSCSAKRRNSETCPDEAVKAGVKAWGPERIVMVGDVQYPSHGMRDYTESYLKVWGDLREITRAVPGNHEYEMSGASGYFEAWGPESGMWSEKIGEWLLVGINTSDGCGVVKCDSESEMYAWLEGQTQAARCVVVFGHHPRLSSGTHGDTARLQDMWEMMERNGVEAYISGHDHHYERIAGESLTQYVVGTGGAALRPVKQKGETIVENRHGFLAFSVSGERADVSFESPDGSFDTHSLTCR